MQPPPDSVARFFDAGADAFHSLTPLVWGPIGRSAADASGARAGDRVLDVCCGSGASALPLAAAVGPQGHVDAIDLAPGLIEIGCRAAAVQRLDDVVTFRTADATTWADGLGASYDALVCVLGAFMLPEMTATVRDLVARTVRPGGRVVITSWTDRGMRPIGPILWTAVQRHTTVDEPSGRAAAQRLESADGMRSWAAELGLVDVRVNDEPRRVTLDASSAWALCTGTGFAGLLDGLDDAARTQVRADVEAGMAVAGWDLDVSVRHLVAHRPSTGDPATPAAV